MVERGMRVSEAGVGDELPAAHPCTQTLELLRLRRSSVADSITEPGPTAAQIEALLEIGARVPDHRRVVPYRFILFQGAARAQAGDVLAARWAEISNISDTQQSNTKRHDLERKRFLRAPLVVGVVSCVDVLHKTPAWEQILSAGAVCQNLLIAASAQGFAAQWLTEWYSYDAKVLLRFGVLPGERMAGFVYIGTAGKHPTERARPKAGDLCTDWSG